MNRFVVVITAYNIVKDIGRCLESILSQKYKNYDVMVVDDYSDDGTWEEIKKYNVNAIRNGEHIGSAIPNRVRGLKYIQMKDSDIIVSIDGDDYLANDNVLNYLNKIYRNDIWLTYGQYTSLSGKFEDICQPFDKVNTTNPVGQRIVISLTTQEYRNFGIFFTSHLKTFRKFLWDKIDDDDLRYEGEYFKTCCDVCMMFPMIEMAGKHIHFIKKILYIYNDLSNDYGGRAEENIKNFRYLQGKQQYKEL